MTGSLNTLAKLAIAGYLVLVPLSFVWVSRLGGHDAARLLQVGLMALCAVAALGGSPRHALGPGGRLAGGWTASMLVLALGSVALAPAPAWAWRELGLWVGMLAVVQVMAQDTGSKQWVAWAVVVGTLLYSVTVLGMSIVGLAQGLPPRAGILTLGYDNYRFLNHVQSVAFPLVLLSTQALRGSVLGRRCAASALALGIALLLATGGRATALAVVVGAASSLLVDRRAAWPLVRRLIVAVAAGSTLYALVFLALARAMSLAGTSLAGQVGNADSVHARLYLWRLAIEQAWASPWWGGGPMHFAHWPNGEAAHPHNVYLQIAAEWGLPMLLLILAGLGVGLLRWARMIRAAGATPRGQEGAALWMCAVAALVDGFASGNFVMPVSQVWIAVAGGCALRWIRDGEQVVPATASRSVVGMHVATHLAAVMLCSWLLAVTVRDLGRLDDQINTSKTLSLGSERYNPRFWSAGWF